jgi:chromosome segregation ATPase
VDTAALEQTRQRLAAKNLQLESDLRRQSVVKAELDRARAAWAAFQRELTALKDKQREFANRTNEIASKRETLDRLIATGRVGDLEADLRREADVVVRCCRRGAALAAQWADAVRLLGQTELERGLAQLRCRTVESENSEKREQLEELDR